MSLLPPVIATLLADVSQFQTQLGKAQAEMDKTGASAGGMSALTKVGLLAAGAAIAGVAAASVDMGIKFQDSTHALAASADISVAAANRIGAAFTGQAFSTTFSAETTIKAYTGVAAQMDLVAGHVLSAAQSLAFMKTAQDLAEGSGNALGSTTSDLAKVMQAYQIPLKGSSDASNILFNASRDTGVGLDTVSQGLARAKAAMGAAAPPLSTMGGLMLDLTQHGETGRQAISSLTSAFTGIISPTAAVTAAQQSMGLSFINAKTGGLDPLKQILTELQPVLAGHSAAEDAATLKTLGFGAASTKLAETFAAGPAVLQKYTDEVTKAGSAQDAAAKQASTMKGELDKLKSGAGDLMTELGTVLVPVLTKVVGGLLDFANAISTHIPLIQKIIGVIGQWALVLAGPIGWLVLLYIHMAGFRAAVADFVSVAVGDFGKAIAFIKQIVGDVTSWISAHWTQIVDDAQIAWNIVSTFIKIAWQVISTIISVALAVIVPILEVAWSVIYNAVTIAWTLISTIIGTAITVIIAVIKTIVAIVTFLVGVWQTVTSDVSGFIGGVVKFFSDLPGKIMGAISGIYSTVGGFLKGVWNTVSSDVGTAIGNVVTWFTGLPGKIKNALSGALTWLFDIGKNIITGLLNGIKSAMNDVKNFVTGIAGSIMSWKGPLDYDATILIPHGNAIMAGLVAGIQQGLNGPVKAALGQVTSTIAGTSLSPMSLGAGNLAVAGGGGGGIGGAASGRQINITYNIPVTGDMSPQTALYVRQQFDQHDQQLITTLNAL